MISRILFYSIKIVFRETAISFAGTIFEIFTKCVFYLFVFVVCLRLLYSTKNIEIVRKRLDITPSKYVWFNEKVLFVVRCRVNLRFLVF